jgi:hypothetical protein
VTKGGAEGTSLAELVLVLELELELVCGRGGGSMPKGAGGTHFTLGEGVPRPSRSLRVHAPCARQAPTSPRGSEVFFGRYTREYEGGPGGTSAKPVTAGTRATPGSNFT